MDRYSYLVGQLRVFASFDCERDEDLLGKLIEQGKSRTARFTVFDRSCRDDFDSEDAEERLRERIARTDAVVVLCGEWTHLAVNVSLEVKVAQGIGKRYYLVKGRLFKDCSRPSTARISDRMFKWGRNTVDELVLRNI